MKYFSMVLSLVIAISGCSRKSIVTAPPDTNGSTTIYLDNTQQIIRGFGAANIVGWRPDMTPSEIQTAFGTGPGELGFSIMRLRIPPDSTQFAINFPSAKAASAMGVTIIATPWTPPRWMKSNKSNIGGILNASSYAAYAGFLKSFADTMFNNGAPLYAISVQNEPDANVTYESCSWSPAGFFNFMKNNAPSVGVPVFLPESMRFDHAYSDSALSDPAVAANVAFIGGHIYGTSPSLYPRAIAMGKEVWMTEYLDLDTSWAAVVGTAKSTNDCMNVQMSAYLWWYIVRYYGPIGEDGVVTKRGYVMSQFARFIRPGFHRVSTSAQSQANICVTAYKNGSKVVIVALNTGSSSVNQRFVIPNSAVVSFTDYVTSVDKNCTQGTTVQVNGGIFTATLAPSSVTTFVSN